MSLPDADVRTMRKDVLLLLGFPAVFVGIIGYVTWPWTTPVYTATSQEAFFELAAGTWDWMSDSSCTANPQVVSFSPDRNLMIITMRERWETSTGDSARASVYDLSERSRSHVRGAIRNERRTTEDGLAVQWDLVLQGTDRFAWHRTDWDSGATTASLQRCPVGTESLVPPLSAAERAALGLDAN